MKVGWDEHVCQAIAGTLARSFAFVMQFHTWDDHDIFDGWGSYPAVLQNCAVFQV
jgi:hypothetical protein